MIMEPNCMNCIHFHNAMQNDGSDLFLCFWLEHSTKLETLDGDLCMGNGFKPVEVPFYEEQLREWRESIL